MDPQQAAARLVQLTNMSQSNAARLIKTWGAESLDSAITDAQETKLISADVGAGALLALLTGLSLQRCQTLVDTTRDEFTQAPDVYKAIRRAEQFTEIPPKTSIPARLSALTKSPLDVAKQYLNETSTPEPSIQRAVLYMKAAEAVAPNVASLALMRLYTDLSERLASHYLRVAGSKGLVESIKLAGVDGQFSGNRALVAQLQARFQLEMDEAQLYLALPEVNGDFNRAVQQVIVDRFMKETGLDRYDARAYLDKTKGNVEKAREQYLQERCKEPILDAENGDTRHPPDVQPNTHVIAVLGVTDESNRACPDDDGWMVSDFYLWKNVLRGMGKSQQWITCEHPQKLVEKYGTVDKKVQYTNDQGETLEKQISWSDGYLHGDPFEERRVVLDKNMLPFAQQQLHLTSRGTQLRDEFLQRLEATCRTAVQANDHVLVLAFCHGDIDDTDLGGLVIGIDPKGAGHGDYLTPELFQKSYAKTPNVKLSLFMTSCFSGHWVITPRFRLIRPNVMAAARPFEESWAWTQSASQRHAGGVYSSSFLNELLKEPSGGLSDILAQANSDETRTYHEYRRDVLKEANRLCIPDKVMFGSLPLFTTEGGEEEAFKRTGFALYNYQANFDQLKRIPASDNHPFLDKKRDLQPDDPEVKAWEARHPEAGDPTFADRTGCYGSTRRGIDSSTLYLAKEYISSHPGAKEQPSNTHLHAEIVRFFTGQLTGNAERIAGLRSQLLHRNWMMERANKYAASLNLNKAPRIQELDMLKNLDKTTLQLAQRNFEHVHAFRLFRFPDVATEAYGPFWLKPTQYLAYAFAASGYGPQDVNILIPKLLENTVRPVTLRKVEYLTKRGSKRAKQSIGKMTDLLQSPRKRHRSSLASTGWMREG